MSDYQTGFEAGLSIGLRAASAILREGGDKAAVDRYISKIEGVRARREREAAGERVMVEADIMLRRPVMLAGDIGWPNG